MINTQELRPVSWNENTFDLYYRRWRNKYIKQVLRQIENFTDGLWDRILTFLTWHWVLVFKKWFFLSSNVDPNRLIGTPIFILEDGKSHRLYGMHEENMGFNQDLQNVQKNFHVSNSRCMRNVRSIRSWYVSWSYYFNSKFTFSEKNYKKYIIIIKYQSCNMNSIWKNFKNKSLIFSIAIIIPTLWLYIQSRFGASQKVWFGLIVSGYEMSAIVLAPLVGRLCDMTGRTKQIIMTTNFVSLIGCFMYSFPISPLFLFISRIIAGETHIIYDCQQTDRKKQK